MMNSPKQPLSTEASLDAREEILKNRLERLSELEAQIVQKERELKAKETAKKSVLLRLPPSLHNQIAAWAEEDFRSINGQIEYLLSKAVNEKYRKA